MITIDFDRLRLKPGDRVLDAGCGSGRHAARACELENVCVTGMDAGFQDCCSARDRLLYNDAVCPRNRGRWCLASADILYLPFPGEFFDHVICSEVMEHIPRERAAAGELLRVLKPGGSLAVSVPRYLPEKICWMLSSSYYLANGGHVRIYRKNELRKLFEGLGAEFRGFHYAHSLHTPYWWLKCLVGPSREDSPAVNCWRRFLEWDIMKKPGITRLLDRLLNPVLGKSLVMYFQKKPDPQPAG